MSEFTPSPEKEILCAFLYNPTTWMIVYKDNTFILDNFINTDVAYQYELRIGYVVYRRPDYQVWQLFEGELGDRIYNEITYAMNAERFCDE